MAANQGMISKGITLKIGDLTVTGLQSTPEISESILVRM